MRRQGKEIIVLQLEIAFKSCSFKNPDNAKEEYMAFEYKGRTYIPYGTVEKTFGEQLILEIHNVTEQLKELIFVYGFNKNTLSRYLELPIGDVESLTQGNIKFLPGEPIY